MHAGMCRVLLIYKYPIVTSLISRLQGIPPFPHTLDQVFPVLDFTATKNTTDYLSLILRLQGIPPIPLLNPNNYKQPYNSSVALNSESRECKEKKISENRIEFGRV